MWQTIGASMASYRSYPRIVGETGGKDFVVAHASADPEALATAIVRGGYEFQGQKCSAVSRIYIPRSLWPGLRDRLAALIAEIRVGDVQDFRNFMGAVIDEKAFRKISGYLDLARASGTVVAGGTGDASTGHFVQPTLVEVAEPDHRLLREEIFGPIVTAYVYDDAKWEETLTLVDRTSPYALTGAVFASDRRAVRQASSVLRQAAGNFYVNDKPTGAVVGQQPFGGARGSGTNDKAGSRLNLLRWVSARTVKENFNPPRDYRYPFMDAE
jgi:1-pyrroline-5-carboxylate dehydrogenase